ncbi:MAG: DNA polymerase III subunit chi [Fluviibacter sp.]
MTQIDCYHDQPDRLTQAVRLAVLAWERRKPITFFIPDPAHAAAFDQALWATEPTAFIPHCYAHSAEADRTLIIITDNLEAVAQDELLVNLGDDVPPGFARYQRLFEIVTQRDADKATARSRMAFYKDRGYPITYRKSN